MAGNTLTLSLTSKDFDIADVDVVKIEGREHIAQLFEFEVLIVRRNSEPLDLDEIVGTLATLIFQQQGAEVRRICGMLREVEFLYQTEADHQLYRLWLVPRMWLLTLVETFEIYMHKSVPEIIEEKLTNIDLGSAGQDFELRLEGNYPTREFIVQYNESDFAFISRLTEHLGISYFFEHGQDGEKVVFVDDRGGFSQISDDNVAHYRGRGERTDVFRLSTRRKMIPRAYVCRDYNYRNPRLELMSLSVLEQGDAGGVVEYGGHFKTPAEGEQLVSVRAEQRLTGQRVHAGSCDLPLFSAGHTFSLAGHPQVGGALLLTCVKHSLVQAAEGEFTELVGDGGNHYEVQFEAVAALNTYRPARTTPVPRIHGVISGVVETDNHGALQKFAKLDDQGRYTVRFLFDIAPEGERKASRPVRRIQPLAGPNYGIHFPLRPGVEVLMVFIDGDPDRPLIVGAVPNPVTPTPVDAATSSKSRIKTESGIMIELDDGAG